MIRKLAFILLCVAVALGLFAAASSAADGTASVKFGYVFVSDTGSLNLNQETFNTYQGFGLSLQNLRYDFGNGLTLGADLRNITLNNRDLRALLRKPGRFSLAVTNSQYRRVYSEGGGDFTRRARTGAQASYQLSRYFKFNGGFDLNDEHGTDVSIVSTATDTVISSADYAQTSYNVGTQIGDRYGVIRLDYRHYLLNDRTARDIDHKGDNFVSSISSSIPGCKELFVAGGYAYRKDAYSQLTPTLRTNEVWGALKASLPQEILAEYRLVYDMTKHSAPLRRDSVQEYDNITHTAMIGKTFKRFGGLQVGYESRIADDFTNKTSSNGYIFNGWLRPTPNWYLSARLTTRKKDVSEGSVLTGVQSGTRSQATVSYTDTAWGNASVKWQSSVRKNDDILSKVTYQSINPNLEFKLRKYGRLVVSYSYYTGKFDDLSDSVSYEFQDHIITGTIYLPTYKNFTADVGGTYYRSKKSQDLEKSHLNFGLMYTFLKEYHVEARYNVFNYDNFLLNNSYYTGNIVEVNLIKDISF